MNPPIAPKLLEMRSLTRRFPGVLALSKVNFEVEPGKVVALVGKNSAGKSTLMKILSGVYMTGGGEITFKGKPVHFPNPRQARRLLAKLRLDIDPRITFKSLSGSATQSQKESLS